MNAFLGQLAQVSECRKSRGSELNPACPIRLLLVFFGRRSVGGTHTPKTGARSRTGQSHLTGCKMCGVAVACPLGVGCALGTSIIYCSLCPQSSLGFIYSLLRSHKPTMLPPGVILVFCILGVVGLGLFSLFIYKKVDARRKLRQAY
ncbi:hypothetical protein V1517DRAFT_130789 [Lipomyces orientalis]|uniref:Uncharacterized protein n=1 Tax=Lipomyces orientalis TaxID=1233043 RepID=A0ACC3TNX6_9ASCO